MDKFAEVIQREPSLKMFTSLRKNPAECLQLQKPAIRKQWPNCWNTHTTSHSPLTLYNNEAELASIIRWVYLKALDFYRIEREDKAGIGYVDFIFYPFQKMMMPLS